MTVTILILVTIVVFQGPFPPPELCGERVDDADFLNPLAQ